MNNLQRQIDKDIELIAQQMDIWKFHRDDFSFFSKSEDDLHIVVYPEIKYVPNAEVWYACKFMDNRWYKIRQFIVFMSRCFDDGDKMMYYPIYDEDAYKKYFCRPYITTKVTDGLIEPNDNYYEIKFYINPNKPNGVQLNHSI